MAVSANDATRKSTPVDETGQVGLKCEMNSIVRRLTRALKAVIASEPEVTGYDYIVGDGDCGTTLKRGAEGKMKTSVCLFSHC